MTTVVVDGTVAEIAAARRGPVAWDVAMYGSLLRAPFREVEVVPLPSRPSWSRVPQRRRAAASRDPDPRPEPMPVSPSRVPRWERTARRLREVDLARRPAGADVALSHLRHLRTLPSLPLVWSTNGVIPELWSWRPGPEAAAVRDRHVALQGDLGRRAERIVCWTEWGADHLIRLAGVDAARVEVAAPVLDLPSPDGPPLPAADGVQVLFIGRAGRLKGLPEAMDAAARVPGVVLHVVGPDTPSPAPVGTVWHGPVPPAAVAALVASADLLLVPARQETYGVTYLEAMRAGVPVLASDLGTVREIVGDAGLLVPAGDADALTRALADLVADEVGRKELGDRGRDRYADRFDPAVTAPRWEALLR